MLSGNCSKTGYFSKIPAADITISGGEAAYQPEFALNILLACREESVHTAIETCGFAPEKTFLKLAEQTDLLLYDLKHMDSESHRRKTGVPQQAYS